MDNQLRIANMRQKLTEFFCPTYLEIIDESHHHVGHAGAASGAGHFRLEIASRRFDKLSLAARHRLVYEVLADMMQKDIHALSMKTFTPEER